MKKNLFLAMLVVLIVSASSYAQKSSARFGDKNGSEIKQSQGIFWEQINRYQKLLSDIENKNSNLQRLFNSEKDQDSKKDLTSKIKENNSLILSYRAKIDLLEVQSNEFLVKSLGKDEVNSIDLKSRNLPELTDAIAIMQYYRQKKSAGSDSNIEMTDSVLIENRWYREVGVKITGPGIFHTGFILNGNSSTVLNVPCPGTYFISYDFGNQVKCVVKKFDGINTDFDPITKNRYAFISGINSQ